MTIHLHQPTQCQHFTEEFIICGRKVPRMVTRCNRARQNLLSHCYMGDTRFANLTAQYSQRRARRDLWLKVRNTTEIQFQLRDPLPLIVCRFKTPSCVRSKRLHVCTCNTSTCSRHMDVLWVHTETFWMDTRRRLRTTRA